MDIKKYEELAYSGCKTIDVRKPASFAEGFIPGSLSLADDALKLNLEDAFIEKDQALILTGEEDQMEWALETFKEKGFSEIRGYFPAGFEHWLQDGNEPDMIISATLEELRLDVKHDNDVRVIDIRTKEAFNKVHVEKAINIPVNQLHAQWPELPSDKPYFVYGDNDAVSMTVVSYLKQQGRHNFYHVPGGINAFEKEEVPLIQAKKQQGN